MKCFLSYVLTLCLLNEVPVMGCFIDRDLCLKVNCGSGPTEEDCKSNGQFYSSNGTYCGCCPKCLDIISEGGFCNYMPSTPRHSICAAPSKCIRGVCSVKTPQDDDYPEIMFE